MWVSKTTEMGSGGCGCEIRSLSAVVMPAAWASGRDDKSRLPSVSGYQVPQSVGYQCAQNRETPPKMATPTDPHNRRHR